MTGRSRIAAWLGALCLLIAPVQGEMDGRQLFQRVWTVQEGLGPMFNGSSCAACHAADGSTPTGPAPIVWVSPTLIDATGGHLFQRFAVREGGGVKARQPPAGAGFRRAPPLWGIGLLEVAVVPPHVPTRSSGRFGWKARYPTVKAAVAGALAGEMGLTSTMFPYDGDRTRHPELTDAQVQALAEYVRQMPPPQARPTEDTSRGRALFRQVGCTRCHVPLLKVPDRRAPIAPYTDLAVHDLGPALADGVAENAASVSQFRTAPLWGLGRLPAGYLHDGRAATLHDAIVAHDGEAAPVTKRYRELDAEARRELLDFLESL